MKIKLTKIASGVLMEQVSPKPQKIFDRYGRGTNVNRVMQIVEGIYTQAVLDAFERSNQRGSGYHKDFKRFAHFKTNDDGKSKTMQLEPWGFAIYSEGKWHMPDVGSTPTSGRMEVLMCYQAPLDQHIKQTAYGERVEFSRIYDIVE